MNLTATIPIQPGSKRALVPWQAYQHAPPTTEEQTVWAARWPNANRALITGTVSGVVVLDVDPRRNGTQSLQNRVVPVTYTVQTPSGGHHAYFAHPGRPVPCVVGLLPGVDLKADGGYVLVPPSRVFGVTYTVTTDGPLAPLPAWIDAELRQRNGANTLPRLETNQVAMMLRGVASGARNDTATRLAGRYLARGLPAGEVLELLRAWNQRNDPPLPEAELLRTVESIARRENAKRMKPSTTTTKDKRYNYLPVRTRAQERSLKSLPPDLQSIVGQAMKMFDARIVGVRIHAAQPHREGSEMDQAQAMPSGFREKTGFDGDWYEGFKQEGQVLTGVLIGARMILGKTRYLVEDPAGRRWVLPDHADLALKLADEPEGRLVWIQYIGRTAVKTKKRGNVHLVRYKVAFPDPSAQSANGASQPPVVAPGAVVAVVTPPAAAEVHPADDGVPF